jgi:hypothetical protein
MHYEPQRRILFCATGHSAEPIIMAKNHANF